MVAYLCLFTQLNFIASKMADLTNLFDKTTCHIRPLFCQKGWSYKRGTTVLQYTNRFNVIFKWCISRFDAMFFYLKIALYKMVY